ncbi:hypothetical protein H6F90_12175 [Trichocoleus sp. FACHB-591]|uniref:hypothetical protein n=1 Tax=Trichocoleus sp. FACHB-591 TaxID=2692872 RepID=UPI001683C080|nr:hypothetical protein [Trichocoleus sp. FACHB-591]MBD2095904.1 hypothetical protein [Trichocoleus sp. FACHB-591]
MTTATTLIQPKYLHFYSLVYKAHYLCPVVAPGGFTFEVLTSEGEFMSNDICYPSVEAAIEAGKRFMDRWLSNLVIGLMYDELYDQGHIDQKEYRRLSDSMGEVA